MAQVTLASLELVLVSTWSILVYFGVLLTVYWSFKPGRDVFLVRILRGSLREIRGRNLFHLRLRYLTNGAW